MRIDPDHTRAVVEQLRAWGYGISERTENDLVAEFDVVEGDPSKNEMPGFRGPETSRKAALDAYPRTGSQRLKVLLCLVETERRFPGRALTYDVIEFQTGVKGAWKRLSELKQGGWIEVAGQKKISMTGSMGDAYVITAKTKRYYADREPSWQ